MRIFIFLFLAFLAMAPVHSSEDESLKFAETHWMKSTAVELHESLIGGELEPREEMFTLAALLAKTIRVQRGESGFSDQEITLLKNEVMVHKHASIARDLLAFYREETDFNPEFRKNDLQMLARIHAVYMKIYSRMVEVEKQDAEAVQPLVAPLDETDRVGVLLAMSQLKELNEQKKFTRIVLKYFSTTRNIQDPAMLNDIIKDLESRSDKWKPELEAISNAPLVYYKNGNFLVFAISGGDGFSVVKIDERYLLQSASAISILTEEERRFLEGERVRLTAELAKNKAQVEETEKEAPSVTGEGESEKPLE